MARIFKVAMVLVLDDDAQHPRKWVADAINENLEAGEDIFDIEIEEFATVEEALPLDNDE